MNCVHLIRENEEGNNLIIIEIEEDSESQAVRREPIASADSLSQAMSTIEYRLIELGCSFPYAKLEAETSANEFIQHCTRFRAEVQRDMADAAAEQASPNGTALH